MSSTLYLQFVEVPLTQQNKDQSKYIIMYQFGNFLFLNLQHVIQWQTAVYFSIKASD